MGGSSGQTDAVALARKREIVRGAVLAAVGFLAGSGAWYWSSRTGAPARSAPAAASVRLDGGAIAGAPALQRAAAGEPGSGGGLFGWLRRVFGLGSRPGRRAPTDALAETEGAANPFPRRPGSAPPPGTAADPAAKGDGAAGAPGAPRAAADRREADPQSTPDGDSLTLASFPKIDAGSSADAASVSAGVKASARPDAKPSAARPAGAASSAPAAKAGGNPAGAAAAAGGASASPAAGPAAGQIAGGAAQPSQAGDDIPAANGGYGCTSACGTGLCDWNGNCCPPGTAIDQNTRCGSGAAAGGLAAAAAPTQAPASAPAPAPAPAPPTCTGGYVAGNCASGGNPGLTGGSPIPAPAPGHWVCNGNNCYYSGH